MTHRNLIWTAVATLAVMAWSADRASAQYYQYNYRTTPYGTTYSGYTAVPNYSWGYNPYTGFGVYNNPTISGYQGGYYSNPWAGSGYYNRSFTAPSVWGPGGYQYNYWRSR